MNIIELWDSPRKPMNEGYRVIPSIDRDAFGDREHEGLEGPINANGRPLYYDKREGKYYDPRTDLFLSHDEAEEALRECGLMEDGELQIGDTVRIKKTTFAGRAGTIKDIGRGGMFVVVELPGVGIKSFDASDVMPIVNRDDWEDEETDDIIGGRHYSDWDDDDLDEGANSNQPKLFKQVPGAILWRTGEYQWVITDDTEPYELLTDLSDHTKEEALGTLTTMQDWGDGDWGDDMDESAEPAYGSDWEKKWNPSMEESLESDSDDIVDDMDQEEMGLHEGGMGGPHMVEKDCGMILWQIDHYHYAITKAAQPFEMVESCPDCSYDEAKKTFDELCSVNTESAEPAYGSDWEHRWNPSMEEGRQTDRNQLLSDLESYWYQAQEEEPDEAMDISGAMEYYQTLSDQQLQREYNRLHDIYDDEDMEESAEPAWGTDWVHRWRTTMESIDRSPEVSTKRPFTGKQRLDERAGPLKIVRWAKPWRDAGRDGLNARGDAKAEPWSDEWSTNYKGQGVQGPKDDNGPIQQRLAQLNPEYDTDYVKDYNPAFTQDGHDEPFVAKNPAPLDAGNDAPEGTEWNELVNVDGNIQPVKRNVKVVAPPDRLKMPMGNVTRDDEIYNNKLSYWKGKEKKDLPKASQMIPIGKSEVASLIYDQDENYWDRTGAMPVKESKIRARLKEGFIARFGKKRFNERQLDEAIYAIVEQYLGVKKLTEDQIGIMACQVLRKLKK